MDISANGQRRSMAPSLAIGSAQGLLLYALASAQEHGNWTAAHPAWAGALWCAALFLAPMAYALRPWAAQRAMWICYAMLSLFALAAGACSDPGAPGASHNRNEVPADTLLVTGLALFHALPFLQARLESGRWSPKYTALFHHTWLNVLQLALAALFAGVVELLLGLWSELFAMLGLPVIKVLMHDIPGLGLVPPAIAFGIGFQLAGTAGRLLTALRQQVLGLLKWLLPMAVAIMATFVVALALRAPALIASKQHVIRAAWLLWLVVLAVYLYNAAYEDGTGEPPYPPLLGKLLRWATPLLLLLSLMAAWEVWVRIDAYGFTAQRYWAAVVALATLAYAASYARVGLRGGAWMAGLSRSNELVALGIVGLLAISLVPACSPGRVAAQSQAYRLAQANGNAGPDDFMRLRFGHGREGHRALQQLAADARVAAPIREGARAALAVAEESQRHAFRYSTIAHAPPRELLFEAFPAGTSIDAGLRALLEAQAAEASPVDAHVDFLLPGGSAIDRDVPVAADAGPPAPWPVLFIDLDGDHQPEAVAWIRNGNAVYARSAQGWHEVASLVGGIGTVDNRPAERSRFLARLRAGDYAAVVPRWRVLEIAGEKTLVVEPGERKDAAGARKPR